MRSEDAILGLYLIIYQRVFVLCLFVMSATTMDFGGPLYVGTNVIDMLVPFQPITPWVRAGLAMMGVWLALNIVSAIRDRPYGRWKAVIVFGGLIALMVQTSRYTLSILTALDPV